MNDAYKRSVLKAITWRILGVCFTIMFLLLATGSWNISLSIGVLDGITKTIAYIIHERIWNKIKWGKNEN